MQETKISIQKAFQPSLSDALSQGSSCSESEPFALQTIDDSMQPEFDAGCIIIIDPTGIARDGAFVLAKDHADEFIFRQLRIHDGKHFLVPLNDIYDTLEISGVEKVEGVITQRAGRRRSYHKRYD